MIEEPTVIGLEPAIDNRGSFTRILDSNWIGYPLAQISLASTSKHGTFRGLHYLLPAVKEWKCVFVASGSIFDVVVDIRSRGSAEPDVRYFELSDSHPSVLVIPPGWAHGYLTKSDNCQLVYAMSSSYSAKDERGLRYDDPELNLALPFTPSLVSKKDLSWGGYYDVS